MIRRPLVTTKASQNASLLDMRICEVEGCERKHYGNGYCKSHGRKMNLYGDPLGGGTRWGEPLAFLHSIEPTDDCIIWPFAIQTKRGYGTLRVDGRIVFAHRQSLIAHAGPAPVDRPLACHGPCHNPACVNPRHLSWGTSASNARDRIRDGSQRKGESYPIRKLNASDVIEMRRLREEGIECKELAERYGVSRPLVSRICRRLKWSSVP